MAHLHICNKLANIIQRDFRIIHGRLLVRAPRGKHRMYPSLSSSTKVAITTSSYDFLWPLPPPPLSNRLGSRHSLYNRTITSSYSLGFMRPVRPCSLPWRAAKSRLCFMVNYGASSFRHWAKSIDTLLFTALQAHVGSLFLPSLIYPAERVPRGCKRLRSTAAYSTDKVLLRKKNCEGGKVSVSKTRQEGGYEIYLHIYIYIFI